MKKFRSSLIGLLWAMSLSANASLDGFTSSEHKAIGDNVAIRMTAVDMPPKNFTMKLGNGLILTYGEMTALGDFYAIAAAPISKGIDMDVRVQRFINAFNTLAVEPKAAEEAAQIIKVIYQERKMLDDIIAKGKVPSEVYPSIAGEFDRQFNCITGGGCDVKTWWLHPGRHLRLSMNNYDHFGNSAWLAYEAGHRAAMNEAVEAYRTGDQTHLLRAYAMNGLASHYLSDRFASGHIRTPRVELADSVTPTIIGDLLAKFMHDEESYGLDVHDASGQHWRAYGDSNYVESKNDVHRQHIADAMQLSADEIFAAYQSGKIIENSKIYDMLPVADEMDGVCNHDNAAMFRLDTVNHNVLRRYELNDKHACSWTSYWIGWSTAVQLASIKGLPVHAQGRLAMSRYAKQAVKAGIITDRHVLAYINSAAAAN